METLTNQSGNDEMDGTSLKVISISLRIIALAVVASFGAVITSYFSVKIAKPPFNNIDQFVTNGQYKAASYSYNHAFFYVLIKVSYKN